MIQSRGKESRTSGPDPVCSIRIVSASELSGLPVANFFRSSSLSPARESLPTMR